MRFYTMRRRGIFLLCVGVVKESDVLQRYYFYQRVFIIVGPYEFGIEKKYYMTAEKGGR